MDLELRDMKQGSKMNVKYSLMKQSRCQSLIESLYASDPLDGFYLSIFIQLSPNVIQLLLGSALCLLQLRSQLLLQIQPQLLTALSGEL